MNKPIPNFLKFIIGKYIGKIKHKLYDGEYYIPLTQPARMLIYNYLYTNFGVEFKIINKLLMKLTNPI